MPIKASPIVALTALSLALLITNLSHGAAPMKQSKATTLRQSLRGQLGNDAHLRFNRGRPQVRYMSGRDLAPGFGCPAFVNTSTAATAAWLAQCVLPQAAQQAQTPRKAVRAARTEFLLQHVQAADEMQYYRFQQIVAGQPTCEGPIVLTMAGSRLVTLSGSLVPPRITLRSLMSHQPPTTVPGETFTQACFSGRASELAFKSTRELPSGSRETITRAMTDSRLLSRRAVENHQSTATEVTASAADFTDLTQFAPVSSTPNIAITAAETSIGGGSSDFCLDSRPDGNSGAMYPIVYETIAGGDALESEMSCMTTESSFLGPFQSDSMLPLPGPLAPSLYFWAYDVGDYAYDNLSFLSSYLSFPSARRIRYIVSQTSNVQQFHNDGDYFRIQLGAAPEKPLITYSAPAQNIGSLAHEFGHAIHDAYGLPSNSTGALREGFADHNCVRYWLYRDRSVRTWDNLTADYTLGPITPGQGRDNRTGHGYLYGQSAAMLFEINPSLTNPDEANREREYPTFYYQPRLRTHPCFNESSTDKYKCGSVLSKIFWTLAHNQVRVPIRATATALAEGDQILLANAHRAQEFVQKAYTSAISSMGSNANVGDFLLSIQTYYTEQFISGKISSTELARINSVFATHCAGSYSDACMELFVSPNHYLPQSYTIKATFGTGTHELFRSDIRKSHHGEETFIATADMTASGDSHLEGERDMEYFELRSSGATIERAVSFPSAGCYQVELLARLNAIGEIRFGIDGSYANTTLASSVGWSWSPSQTVLVDAPGNKTIRIEHISGAAVALNALVVSKAGPVPSGGTPPPPSATDDDGDCIDNAQDRCIGADDNIMDPDRDGLCGAADTCPQIYDPTNSDRDNDGVGDVCDPCWLDKSLSSGTDSDFDGWCDANDNCPDRANPLQKDQDNDGIGDRCEPDFDNDGIDNDEDNCPLQPNTPQADTDNDGAGDICDCDPFDFRVKYAPDCLVDEDLIRGRFRHVAAFLQERNIASTETAPWSVFTGCTELRCDLGTGETAFADAEAYFKNWRQRDAVGARNIVDVILMEEEIDTEDALILSIVEGLLEREGEYAFMSDGN